jgi:hypothetical protein
MLNNILASFLLFGDLLLDLGDIEDLLLDLRLDFGGI